MSRFSLSAALLGETFRHFRECGCGRRECQVLWTSAWHSPGRITGVVHSGHRAHGGGFHVADAWLNGLWVDLAERGHGVRVQVHTHPEHAFHSKTDDDFPIVHMPGFLSLVIPDFGMGPVGFEDAYLCEIGEDGRWTPRDPATTIAVTP